MKKSKLKSTSRALLTNTNQKKYLSVLGKFFRYLKREQLCSDCKKFVKVKSTAAD